MNYLELRHFPKQKRISFLFFSSLFSSRFFCFTCDRSVNEFCCFLTERVWRTEYTLLLSNIIPFVLLLNKRIIALSWRNWKKRSERNIVDWICVFLLLILNWHRSITRRIFINRRKNMTSLVLFNSETTDVPDHIPAGVDWGTGKERLRSTHEHSSSHPSGTFLYQ